MNKQELKQLLHDDFSKAINSLLNSGQTRIDIPKGKYIINDIIYLVDNTYLNFSKNAYVICKKGFKDWAVFTNKDKENGNKNISIIGGNFDGNALENPRNGIYDDFTAIFFAFNKVDGLVIKNMMVKDTVSYHFRLGEVSNFIIKNIKFMDEYSPINQDGIHMGGGCKNGVIKNIYAKPGSMGDDLIALNADDIFTIPVNYGMKDLPISNIHVSNVYAPNCWTGIRLLSYKEEISNCSFKNFVIGYRTLVINMDGDRPDVIFKTSEYPNGVGNLKNITFKNFKFWNTCIRDKKRPCIRFQNNVFNMKMINFNHYVKNEPKGNVCSTISFSYISNMNIKIDGEDHSVLNYSDTYEYYGNKFKLLTANQEKNND